MNAQLYNVVVSSKAKHPRLKMSAVNGLIVTIPRGFDESRIPGILQRKRLWLDRVSQRFAEQQQFLSPEPPGRLPERITLRAINEEWEVDYRTTDARSVSAVERMSRRLLVFGGTDNAEACKDALRRWMSRKTKEHLVPWLARLAKERGLDVREVVVKSQRTRWASCSAKNSISLNLRLLCIPENIVRYVLMHELAHCRYMNHSRRFWAEVRTFEPDFQELDSELRKAWRLIPAWLHSSNSRDLKPNGPLLD